MSELQTWADERAQHWIDCTDADGWDMDTGDPIVSSRKVLLHFWADVDDLVSDVEDGRTPNVEGLQRLEALLNAAASIGQHAARNEVELP